MAVNTSTMLRLVLILVLQCLLTNGQGPGPGPGSSSRPALRDTMQSRAVDTRLNFTVLEGQPTGTYIGSIPTKPGFTYRFNEVPKEFVLNGSTGELHTAKILDREALSTDKFDLVILSSQPTYPIELRIVVLDLNDNAPRFPEPSILVTFSENANAGTRVILDTATDGDAGENDITTNYRIVDGNEEGKFKLEVITNPSGETPYLHLETIEKLDMETRDSYQLNISAQDGGTPPHFGFLLVNVSILDVNDNSPTFDYGEYNVTLSESVPPGTSVLQVRASDADSDENARITYYLAETETQFSIDPETGVITTVERLKCHRNCPDASQCAKSCVFTVNARDHGSPHQDGRTYVTVNLQDANDHNPVVSFTYFPANAEFATVDENAKNASTVAVVSVIDADEGFNGETTVEIAGGNEMNHFRLESKPNYDLVQVNGVLDREKISKYNVTIVATDMGSPPRSSTSFLIIYVNDINDHAPVFEKSEYSAVLSELVPVGTYVAGITANDEDTGVNSNVYYAITSGNNNRWFDIDIESGLITTKALLNREEQDSVDLKISARDGGPNPKRAYTHLKITILDANDEKPTFAESLIQVSLSESAAPHTLVAQVSAIDRDQGTNGSVSYIFSEDVELKYPGLFYLDSSSGRVTTRSKLDREAMPQYDITVEARDRGIPPLSSTATVRLSVLDVNDNSPEFYPQQYFVAVAEDNPIGSSLVQVSATDKDDGENAEIIYELTSGPDNDNTFAIHPQTGVLTLSGRLSRIRKAKYRLTVAAKDKGDRKAAKDAVIEILIEGIQSEFLEFESDLYAFEVSEDTGQSDTFVSKEVGSVSVKYIGLGEIAYTIVAGDPDKVFSIDEKSGVIKTSKHLDSEERSFYSLKAVATTADVYGHTIINITVNDINDNPPKFPTRQAHASVKENWPVGHQVFLAEAYDPDLGKNSDVTYTLTANPRNYFSISKKSGMIYLNKPVKFGHVGTLRLEVTATDDGVPPLSSRHIVMVTVEDVNDHTPIFEHGSYETSLFESIPVNDRFFALTASDEDSGINGFVSYNITSGNDDQKFGIFPDGYLYIRSALDRENKDYYALTIVAQDHGEPSRSATVLVVIHILDENDNAPVFTNKTFDFYLAENAPPDTYVGRLTATDQDKGRNAELTFAIATNQQQFLVDPKSGFLKTLNYFDREKLVQVTGQDYITMEAIVVDNGISKLRDKAKVNIFITDVNDNSPKFSRKSYKAEVFEGASVGTPIVRLAANDADQGLNGDIIYTLVDGNEEGRFQIDGVTGQVALSRQLDRETTPLYLLTVAASDLGSPESLTATTTLSVHVLDENDNKPVFTHKELEISVSETTEVNTVLVQFKASDADVGVNQEVSFMIGGGNIQEVFRIDTRTGTLYLEKPIDYEQRSTYRLNITAADGGSPRLTSTIEFIVRVLDYNDNAPTFPNTTIVRQIQEGIPYKTTIVTISAHDPDSGLNGKITYAIKNQDPPGRHFEIEKDTGVIFTIRDIDREFNDTFMLTVVASDQAEPVSSRLSAEKLVTVVVEDINDNAPVFVSMNAGLLPENSRKDQKIMQILANDIDANTNGLVTYEIVGGSAMDVFYLDRVTGSLRLRKDIPSPELFYRVTVRSTDEAVQSQRKSSDAYLTILGMSSHEGPRFTQSFYTGSVIENSAIGTSVATIESHLETRSPDEINYFVVNVTSDDGRLMERLFDVQQKGVLATAVALDREDGPDVYLVTVAAAVTKSSTPRVSLTQV
ncbi:Cadherin, partial [Trinorchestia longiramus]